MQLELENGYTIIGRDAIIKRNSRFMSTMASSSKDTLTTRMKHAELAFMAASIRTIGMFALTVWVIS